MIKYKGYCITYDPKPIPIRFADYEFVHEDYDGAIDAFDYRRGNGASVDECKDFIDAIEKNNG